jgi:hypothetical protein
MWKVPENGKTKQNKTKLGKCHEQMKTLMLFLLYTYHVSEGTLITSWMLPSDNHVSEGTLITSRSLPSGIMLVKKHLLPVGCYPRQYLDGLLSGHQQISISFEKRSKRGPNSDNKIPVIYTIQHSIRYLHCYCHHCMGQYK